MAREQYGQLVGDFGTDPKKLSGSVVPRGQIGGGLDRPTMVYEKDYEILRNKPQINGVELLGNKSSSDDLGIEILKEDLTCSRSVGGVSAGDEYEQGTMIEKVLRDILNPTDYPTLTNPSAAVTSSIPLLQESGTDTTAVFTVTFNRGSINPAYGTSGYRSGVATGYALNGGASGQSNTFTEAVNASNRQFYGTVSYEAGEQPKDSKGGDYSTPLPAGSVNSPTVSFEFVDAIWASTVTCGTATKQGLLSKSAGSKVFDFPAQTVGHPELFDIPASWTVTAIEVWNVLSNRYEDCAREFDTSNTTHNNAAGEAVNYVRYTDNRGYAADGRRIRVSWR